MTRRALLTTLFGVPITQGSVAASGFEVSGHLTNAGQSGDRYYAIDQSIAFMLDERKHPVMVKQADALLEGRVRLILERA